MRDKYEAYLREEKQFAERSVRDYLWAHDLLASRLDFKSDLQYWQVNNAIKDIKVKEGWSQGTVYKYAVCIKNFFRWASREGLIVNNPYPFTDWKKPRAETPKFLTEELFLTIIRDPHLSFQEHSLLWLLWDSGARVGEIAKLRKANFDLEKRLVTIPYEISKGSYSHRIVPFSKNLKAALEVQFGMMEWDYLFMGSDFQPLTLSGLQKVVTNIGKRKSPYREPIVLSPHMFRHSFGVRMLEKGVPETVVQKWLGHSTLGMTSRYINLTSESSRKIYDMHVEKSLVAQGF